MNMQQNKCCNKTIFFKILLQRLFYFIAHVTTPNSRRN